MSVKSIKIVVVGSVKVGKTALIHRICKTPFNYEAVGYAPTVFDNYQASVKVADKDVSLNMWDSAGREDYDRLRPLSYPQTDVFAVCFNVMDQHSFDQVLTKWLPEVQHYCPQTPVILLGLQTDSRHNAAELALLKENGAAPVDFTAIERAVQSCREIKAYHECSAKQDVGMEQVQYLLANCALGCLPPQPPPIPPPPPPPSVAPSASTFANELRAVYNEQTSLPDVRITSAAGGRVVLAHRILLEAGSPGLSWLCSSTADGAYVASAEHEEALFTLVAILYGQAPADVSKLAAIVRDSSAVRLLPPHTAAELLAAKDKGPFNPTRPPVISGLRTCLDQEKSSDICFVCQDDPKPIYAHRAVLSMRCTRFHALFASGMADARKKELPIPNHNRATMYALLWYLYTDELLSPLGVEPEMLFAAASEYDMERLMVMIAHDLYARVKPNTILDLLELAATYNCEPLQSRCLYDMRCNWTVYADRADVKKRLSYEVWKELNDTQHPPITYHDALEKHREELAEWQEKQSGGDARREEKCQVQ